SCVLVAEADLLSSACTHMGEVRRRDRSAGLESRRQDRLRYRLFVESGGCAGHHDEGEMRQQLTQETIAFGHGHPSHVLRIVLFGEEADAAALQALIAPGANHLAIDVG